jgi:Carbohydrate-selective porin, OprB family/S-layer homology domain
MTPQRLCLQDGLVRVQLIESTERSFTDKFSQNMITATILRQTLPRCPLFWAIALLTAERAIAQQPLESMSQVPSVSQLSDVQPTDWAFQALQSLIEQYGCIAGYPDGTYRGHRTLTRSEFAVGLNACLNRIEAFMNEREENLVRSEDLATVQRLMQDFQTELNTLTQRVNTLESQTASLENHQFSTTTKLNGEVIFAIADTFGDRIGGEPDNTQTMFAHRTRLNLSTSFTGKDRLFTRLQTSNITPFNSAVTGTHMTRLSFDGSDRNRFIVDKLEYSFPLGNSAFIYLAAKGGGFDEYMLAFNPLLSATSQGTISRFGRFNPIYRESAGGTGAAITYNLSPEIALSLGYLTRPNVAHQPDQGLGIFKGAYSALAQITYRPNTTFNVGLTYAHSYYNPAGTVVVSGYTGSIFANQPFGDLVTSANRFGLQVLYQPTPTITLAGWGGYTSAIALQSDSSVAKGDNANIWNWALTLAFSDFGAQGNLLGLVLGMPPKVTHNDVVSREDRDTSYHLEAFYRFQVSDFISVTPGIYVILNPEHNSNNPNIYVGVVRTTFRF